MNRPSRKHPNRRKLAELPYQQLHAKQWEELETTLTDFDLLIATCQAGLQKQLVDDYRDSWKALSANGHEKLRVWSGFFLSSAHVLQRGDDQWQANKILLQLAYEHADDSPVTEAAEAWLQTNECHWKWLRKLKRPSAMDPNPVIMVLEGHGKHVMGMKLFDEDKIVTWSSEEVIMWQLSTGNQVQKWVVENGPDIRNRCWSEPIIEEGRIILWSTYTTKIRYINSPQTEKIIELPMKPSRIEADATGLLIYCQSGSPNRFLPHAHLSFQGELSFRPLSSAEGVLSNSNKHINECPATYTTSVEDGRPTVCQPDGFTTTFPADMVPDGKKHCFVQKATENMVFVRYADQAWAWDFQAGELMPLDVSGLEGKAEFIGVAGPWWLLSREHAWDDDQGTLHEPQHIVGIHFDSGVRRLFGIVSPDSRLGFHLLGDGSLLMIDAAKVFRIDPKLAPVFEANKESSLGLVLCITEDWQDNSRWIAIGSRSAALITLGENPEIKNICKADRVDAEKYLGGKLMADLFRTPKAYLAGAELSGDRLLIWGDSRGMGDLGHCGEYEILSQEDGVWKLEESLSDICTMDLLDWGYKDTEDPIPQFCIYTSYAVTWVRDRIVVGQVGSLWLFDGIEYKHGIEDEIISDPFWVDDNRIIFIKERVDGSLEGHFLAVHQDRFGEIKNLEENHPLMEYWGHGHFRNRKGQQYRAYRDLQSSNMRGLQLIEISESGHDRIKSRRAVRQGMDFDSKPFVANAKHGSDFRCRDGSVIGHSRVSVGVRVGAEEEIRWHSETEIRFVMHRISYLNTPEWGMFENEGTAFYGTEVPVITPCVDGNIFFVWDSAGHVILLELVDASSFSSTGRSYG